MLLLQDGTQIGALAQLLESLGKLPWLVAVVLIVAFAPVVNTWLQNKAHKDKDDAAAKEREQREDKNALDRRDRDQLFLRVIEGGSSATEKLSRSIDELTKSNVDGRIERARESEKLIGTIDALTVQVKETGREMHERFDRLEETRK